MCLTSPHTHFFLHPPPPHRHTFEFLVVFQITLVLLDLSLYPLDPWRQCSCAHEYIHQKYIQHICVLNKLFRILILFSHFVKIRSNSKYEFVGKISNLQLTRNTTHIHHSTDTIGSTPKCEFRGSLLADRVCCVWRATCVCLREKAGITQKRCNIKDFNRN